MADTTILHPVGTFFTILMAFFLIRNSREYAMLPILCVAFFLTMNLRVVVAGLDLTMLRIILMVGWLRIFLRGEYRSITLNLVDKLVIWMIVARIVTYTILWGTADAFINRLGSSFDIFSIYFISRSLIRDADDAARICTMLLIMSVPVSILMFIERLIGTNLFHFLGGVPAQNLIREGKIRAQGSFEHAILAGNYGAALLPMVVGLRWRGRISLNLFAIGLATSTSIVIFSNSAGPLVAWMSGIGALICWKFRNQMRILVWGSVVGLLALHIIMKAPVWALVMRLSPGGSAYHRYQVIDQTIRHFWDWWLVGVQSTASWGRLMHDVANQYSRTAVDGGLVTLLLLGALIFFALNTGGRAIRKFGRETGHQRFIWAIGASFFVHSVAFLGINYIGSNLVLFYMTAAMLATAPEWPLQKNIEEQ